MPKRKWDVRELVVGLPLNMDGSDGPSAQSARAFARNFAARSPLAIVMVDERLSTAAVTLTLLDADLSRKRRAARVRAMRSAATLPTDAEGARRSGAPALRTVT